MAVLVAGLTPLCELSTGSALVLDRAISFSTIVANDSRVVHRQSSFFTIDIPWGPEVETM